MSSTFLFAFNAIMPIVLIIGLGYLLKKLRFIDLHFVNLLNKFIFRVALPALLFYNVYQIDDFSAIKWGVVLFAVAGVMISYMSSLILVYFVIKDPRQKGVVLQAIVRSNFAMIGIPLAQTLGGSEALAIVAIIGAFTIPQANILAVIALTLFQRNEEGNRISYQKMALNVISNPLIIAIMAGLFTLFIRGFIPRVDGVLVFSIENNLKFVIETIKLLAVTASPLALISIGGQFEINVVKSIAKQITIGVVGRIIIVPGVFLTLAYLLEARIPGMEDSYAALIALFATPVAVSSVIMAQQLDGDEILAGQMVIWSTLFSMLTLFLIIAFFRSIGAL